MLHTKVPKLELSQLFINGHLFLQIIFHWCMPLVSLPLYLILSLICINIIHFELFHLYLLNSTNTLLFSLFLSYNFALSFYSFSKAPWRLWTNLSISSIIFLFFIFRLENLSKIPVIYTLYYATCLIIIATLQCSSYSTSTPCIDHGVFNLKV